MHHSAVLADWFLHYKNKHNTFVHNESHTHLSSTAENSQIKLHHFLPFKWFFYRPAALSCFWTSHTLSDHSYHGFVHIITGNNSDI